MDITRCPVCIEAGAWNGKIVSAASCPACKNCTGNAWRICKALGKEVTVMWRFAFMKKYANDKTIRRMMAYFGKVR